MAIEDFCSILSLKSLIGKFHNRAEFLKKIFPPPHDCHSSIDLLENKFFTKLQDYFRNRVCNYFKVPSPLMNCNNQQYIYILFRFAPLTFLQKSVYIYIYKLLSE